MLQRAVGKNLPAKAGKARDSGSIPGMGRSPGEGNGNPLQYSCLENSMDGGAMVGYSPWDRKESDTTEHNARSRAHTHTGKKDPEDIMLSEISWSQKDKPCMSSLI